MVKKFLKKLKWVVLALTVLSVGLLVYGLSLVRYAEEEVLSLSNYEQAIAGMSEVVAVNHIHRFNGRQSYIVANVTHESGQLLYFFVHDGQVVHYELAEALKDVDAATTIATELVGADDVLVARLGLLDGVAIFEIQINAENEVHYVILDAKTFEVLLNFTT